MKRAFLSAILTVVLALFVSHQTLAQTRFVWTNGTGNWDATTKWTNELGNANVPVAGGSNDYVITFDGGRANYAAFNVNSGGTGVINSAVIVNSDDSDGGATLGEFAGLGDNGLVTNINGAAWYSE